MNVNSRRFVSPSDHTAVSVSTDPVMVRLRLIGQMEAWTLMSDSILPTGRKTRALLAILALSAPRPVLRGKLAEMLWSRRPEEQARASLRQEIHRLLDALGPVGHQILSINRDHLMLRPGTVWVDVEEVLRASPTKPAALCLLDGDLLEDLDGVDPAFDNWLAAERERLRDRARVLAEQMLRDQPDADLAIPAAQQLLSIDRAHEGAWRALMRAYNNRGERGMAIQAYERCRSVLADLLDALPSEETLRLAAEIRATTPQTRQTPQLSSASNATRTEMFRDPRPLNRAVLTEVRAEQRVEQRHEHRAATPHGGVRVGVMPLQLIGVGEAEAHLSTAIADEITASLARFRSMSLVSSSALARFAAQTRDETAVRRAFNIDLLLDGTIQSAPGRVRISLRLLDLRAGSQIVWSRRFDRGSEDLLSLQDEIAGEVVAQLEPEILRIESQAANGRIGLEPCATDLLLRALPMIGRLERPTFLQAGELLRQALALDPDHAAAHLWAAYWQLMLFTQGWAREPAATMAEAARLADRAVMLDPQDAKALTIAGHIRAVMLHRLPDAAALHDRALLLNPNLAMAWCLSAITYGYLGNLAEAERRLVRYKQLSQLDPQACFLDTALIIVAVLKQDYEAAVAAGREVSEMSAGCAAACPPYLAALGHLGRHPEAEIVRQRLLGLRPDFSIRQFVASSPFVRPQDLEIFTTGLRLAGLQE